MCSLTYWLLALIAAAVAALATGMRESERERERDLLGTISIMERGLYIQNVFSYI